MIRIHIDIPKTFLSEKKRDMYYKAGFFMVFFSAIQDKAPQNTFSKNAFPRDLYSKGPPNVPSYIQGYLEMYVMWCI